jgi:cytidyltransferase-like protein
VLRVGEWRNWDAVVPMRAQPLHFGHLRLVRNMADLFHSVRVVVGNQPVSRRDPFSFGQRRRWLHVALDVYGLNGVDVVRGAHGETEQARVAAYTRGLRSTHTAIVTGNEEVRHFWSDRCPLVLDVHEIVLPLTVAPISDPRLVPREGIGTVIREALGSPRQSTVRELVPPWVWDDICVHRDTTEAG